MPGDTKPEKVAMDSLQLKKQGPDKSGPWRDFYPRCVFYCLTVTRTVYIASYPSYAFGEKTDLIVRQGSISQLFNATVIMEPPVITTGDFFPRDKDPEICRFLKHRIEGADGQYAGRWLRCL